MLSFVFLEDKDAALQKESSKTAKIRGSFWLPVHFFIIWEHIFIRSIKIIPYSHLRKNLRRDRKRTRLISAELGIILPYSQNILFVVRTGDEKEIESAFYPEWMHFYRPAGWLVVFVINLPFGNPVDARTSRKSQSRTQDDGAKILLPTFLCHSYFFSQEYVRNPVLAP